MEVRVEGGDGNERRIDFLTIRSGEVLIWRVWVNRGRSGER